MTNNQEKTITLIQQVYFDICDLLDGSSFIDLGYKSRKEWLQDQQERLIEVQLRMQDTIKEEEI